MRAGSVTGRSGGAEHDCNGIHDCQAVDVSLYYENRTYTLSRWAPSFAEFLGPFESAARQVAHPEERRHRNR